MKKAIIIVFVVLVCCSCQVKPESIEKDDIYLEEVETKENNEDDIQLKLLSEVRLSVSNDYENIKKGKFPNFKTDDIEVVFTPNDEIYNIKVMELLTRIPEYATTPENFIGRLDISEKVIEHYMGEKDREKMYFNRIQLTEDSIDKIINGQLGKRFDMISYLKNSSESMWYQPLVALYVSYGRKLEYGYTDLDKNEFYEKCYYKYSKTKNFNDSHKLISGDELTVNDAISYVERDIIDYLDEYMIVDDCEKEIVKIIAIDYGNDTYSYNCHIRGVYDGIPLEDYIHSPLAKYSGEDLLCSSSVEVIGDKYVDNILYFEDAIKIEKKQEAINKIITLDTAMQLLSENIGVESQYTINSIELMYKVKAESDDGNFGEDDVIIYNGYPVWAITALNNKDNHTQRFYINAVDGRKETIVLN